MRFLIVLISFSFISVNILSQEVKLDNEVTSLSDKIIAIQKEKPSVKKIDLLLKLAHSYYLQMDFEAQLNTLENALALSIQIKNTEKIIEVYTLIAQIRIEDIHNEKRKKESINEALKLLPKTNNYTLITEVKELQIKLDDTLSPPQILKAYQDIFNIKKEKGLSPLELAKSELYIGEAFFNVSILDSSLFHYNNVSKYLDKAPNDIKTALVRGKLYTELGEYYGFKEGENKDVEKTRYFYNKADSIFTFWEVIPNQVYNTSSYSHFLAAIGLNSEALNELTKAYKKSDKYVTASILSNFGLLSYINGNYNESVDFYIKCLEKFDAINDQQGSAIAGLSIAVVYSRIKEFEKAIPYLEKVRTYADTANDPSLTKAVYTTQGKLYFNMQKYAAAIEARKKAIVIDYESENYASIADQKIIISKIYHLTGDLKNAEQYNNEALAYYKNHSNPRVVVTLFENFYNIYKTKGDYKKSLQSLETKIQYQDSLKEQELKDQLNKERANIKVIEAQESVNRTEKEKELLKNEAVLLTTRNRLYIVLGVLASLLFIILYINSRYKNKIEKQKAVEKLRSKISADLHDDVGSLLTGLAMQSEILGKNAPESISPKLERISELSRSAMLKMRDAVWVMDARKDNWQSLIDRINEFASEHLGTKEVTYNLNHHNPSNEEEIDGPTRQHLYLVVKEAIANIIKHSDANNVFIDLNKNKNQISIRIKDNGNVTSLGTSGLGISNIKERIFQLQGKIDINIQDGYQIDIKVPA